MEMYRSNVLFIVKLQIDDCVPSVLTNILLIVLLTKYASI